MCVFVFNIFNNNIWISRVNFFKNNVKKFSQQYKVLDKKINDINNIRMS